MWHVWEEERCAFRVSVRELRKREHFEDLGLDGRTFLRWILKKWTGEAWTGFIWLGTQTGGGLL
jgi:hypothetical protein